MSLLLSALHETLGPKGILTDPADLAAYSVDWRKMFKGTPCAVVRPSTVEEVARLVALCNAHNAPLVPQGGNTGLAGGAVPDASGRAVVLSLARMNRLRGVDPVGMTLEAEAGVVLKTAQEAAQAVNRLLPVSLAAEGSATIGGVIATNAGGINVLRYGMTRALVLGLEVVLPDGRIVNGLRRLRKDNAGYDWKQLFIGSEGTLGIVTAAVLRLLPLPSQSVTALVGVRDPQAALDFLVAAQNECGDTISAFELISGFSMRLVAKHFGLACPVDESNWYVLIEASANLNGLREAFENALSQGFEKGFVQDGVIAESGRQAEQMWQLRERITEAEAHEGKSVKHDVSVPIPAVPDFLVLAGEALAKKAAGVRINCFGHLGDGNLHYNIMIADHDPATINTIVHDMVVKMGGSISAEHGIGQYRVDELALRKSAEEMALCRTIKTALDPMDLMNPGKVIMSRPQQV
jgi:FAD/FMN-containing dehydrogenase